MRAHGNHSFSFKTSEHSHRAHFLGGEMRVSERDNPNPFASGGEARVPEKNDGKV